MKNIVMVHALLFNNMRSYNLMLEINNDLDIIRILFNFVVQCIKYLINQF